MLVGVDRFRLGVNYWPSDTAMQWLARYDHSTVLRDFRRIAAAGMDTVRIFLRWEDVQPSPGSISAAALSHVVDAADVASEVGLGVIVTLFTGHMSGVNWIPGWATGGTEGDDRFRVMSSGTVQKRSHVLRSWYSDPDIVDAQSRLAGEVSSALAGHPGVWAWDLGNENSNCTVPPDKAAADDWLARMTSVLRERDPGRLITVGTHMEDIESDRRLGPEDAARWCDFVCMHGYPFYADWSSGPTDEHLVPFLAEITAWLSGDAPVLFEELGHSTNPPGQPAGEGQVSERDAADYMARTLDRLQGMGCIGALVWCYADYGPELFDSPPLDVATHERSFGMWRADGTPKPVVAEVTARQGLGRLPVAPDRPWLDITRAEFTEDRRRHLVRLYERYRHGAR
jgi:endo-1,4-beta-mannosidase